MTFLDNFASKLALSQVELREECWRSRGEVPVPAFQENHLYSEQNVGNLLDRRNDRVWETEEREMEVFKEIFKPPKVTDKQS